MKDNLDWTHHDSRTVNEDYYQVIEGTRSWGKSYTVNLFEKQLEEKNKEIDRLNNIINELEKWLEKQYQDTEKCFMFDKDLKSKYKRDLLLFSMCLDKLNELKEENNDKRRNKYGI